MQKCMQKGFDLSKQRVPPRKIGRKMALLAVLMVATCAVTGCGKGDNRNSVEQDRSNRLHQISQASGGDWDKVPAADRTYILTTFTHGNENSAKMLLLAISGKLRGNPGGPPGKH